MTQLEHIQSEVKALSKYDFVKLKTWIKDLDFEQWDAQIAADSTSGKLNFLQQEFLEAKINGQLRDL